MKFRMILCMMTALLFLVTDATAQCAMCTKTAAQLGEKPAEGLNAGIVYLMLTPLLILVFLGYKWWKGRVKE